MRRVAGIFAVSVIAIMSATASQAKIVSETMLNGALTSAFKDIQGGTATKITYDAKGLVTKGESLTASDIPTIPSTGVSGLGNLATKNVTVAAEYKSDNTSNDSLVPSVKAVEKIVSATASVMVEDAVAGVEKDYQKKSTAVTHPAGYPVGDATHPVYVTKDGVATEIDKVAAATTADTANALAETALVKRSAIAPEYYFSDGGDTKIPTAAAVDLQIENLVEAIVTYADEEYQPKGFSTVAKDGSYIKKGNAVATNLGNLDTQLKTVSDNAMTGVTGGAAATAKVATAVVKSGKNVSVTMDYVQIPVKSGTTVTSAASIWVE